MRYTTIIDLTASRTLYRNKNVRLVYFHLCLVAGYHDQDRDWCDKSIRQLAGETGISVAAVRHALKQLETAKMVAKRGTKVWVRKWVAEQKITAREKKVADEKLKKAATQRQLEEQQRDSKEAAERRERERLLRAGKDEFMVYFEKQQDAAARGDEEARRIVERQKEQYELHKKIVEQQLKEQSL